MKVGDLVDDGLDNIGIVVEVGWRGSWWKPAAVVHFSDPELNGWYEAKDLEAINERVNVS